MNAPLRSLLGFAGGAILAFAASAIIPRSRADSPSPRPAPPTPFPAPLLAGRVEGAARIHGLEAEVRALEARLADSFAAGDDSAGRAAWRASALAWANDFGKAGLPDFEGSTFDLYPRLSDLRCDLAFLEGIFTIEVSGHPEKNRLVEPLLEARGLPLDAQQSAAMAALLEKEDAEWRDSLSRRSTMTGLEVFANAFRREGESDAALRALLRPDQWAAISRTGDPEDEFARPTGLADNFYSFPDTAFDPAAPDAAEGLARQWSRDLLLPGRSPEILRPYVDDYLRRLGDSLPTRYPPSRRIMSPEEHARHALAQAAVQRAMMNDGALTADERDRVRQWLKFYDSKPPVSAKPEEPEEGD